MHQYICKRCYRPFEAVKPRRYCGKKCADVARTWSGHCRKGVAVVNQRKLSAKMVKRAQG